MNSILLCVTAYLARFDHISVLYDLWESNGMKSPNMGKWMSISRMNGTSRPSEQQHDRAEDVFVNSTLSMFAFVINLLQMWRNFNYVPYLLECSEYRILPVLHFEFTIIKHIGCRVVSNWTFSMAKTCGLKYAFKVCGKIDSSQWNIIMSQNRDTNTDKQVFTVNTFSGSITWFSSYNPIL